MLNVYLYSVSTVSLSAFYLAVIVLAINILKLAFGLEFDTETKQNVASSAGIIMASFPMWFIHWRWLRQQFKDASKNEIFLHRFYLFTIICLSAMAIIISGSVGVSHLVGLFLALHDSITSGLQKMLAAALILLVSLGLWFHHWRQFKGNVGAFLPAKPAIKTN